MTYDAIDTALTRFLEDQNLPSDQAIITELQSYVSDLLQFNKRMNLIGPMNRQEIYDYLIIDSIVILALLQNVVPTDKITPQKILDIGSGAGLPGIPMAIISKVWSPSSHYLLVEPRQRRATFLKLCSHRNQLPVTVYQSRVEDLSPKPVADLVVSKAVTKPSAWLEMANDYLAPGGYTTLLLTESNLDAALSAVTESSNKIFEIVSQIETPSLFGASEIGKSATQQSQSRRYTVLLRKLS